MNSSTFKKKVIAVAVNLAVIAPALTSGTVLAEPSNNYQIISKNGGSVVSGFRTDKATDATLLQQLKGLATGIDEGENGLFKYKDISTKKDKSKFSLKNNEHAGSFIEDNQKDGQETKDFERGIITAISADGKTMVGWKDGKFGVGKLDTQDSTIKFDFLKTKGGSISEGLLSSISTDGKYAVGWKGVGNNTIFGQVVSILDGEAQDLFGPAVDGNASSNAVETAADGDYVAVGNQYSTDKQDFMKINTSDALVWLGSNADKKNGTNEGIKLTKSSADAFSTATAISGNTKVIGGAENQKPVIWSGNNWSELTHLNVANATTMGAVAAFSENGSVAVGNTVDTANSQRRAVKWSGEKLSELSDLGTLKKDNSGNSTVNAITSDGSIASGSADADDGTTHGIIWKIAEKEKQEQEKKEQEKQEQEKKEQEKKEQEKKEQEKKEQEKSDTDKVIKKVDVTNTQKTIAKMAADTFQIIENQHRALTRLQDVCSAADGETCWSVQRGYTSAGKVRDNSAGFTVGYGLSENISAGLSFDRSVASGLPSSYTKANNSFGIGLSVDLHSAFDGGDWYIRPAVAFNKSNVKAERQTLSNTEAGKGGSRMKGMGASLEGGQNFHLDDTGYVGWYAGVRYSDVNRAGFTETNADFPVTYGELKDKRTSVYAGARASVPVTQKLSWVSGIEVDQMLSKDPTFTASADYMGSFNQKANLKKTTGSAKTGVEYAVANNVSVSLTPTVSLTGTGDTAWGGLFGFSGHF